MRTSIERDPVGTVHHDLWTEFGGRLPDDVLRALAERAVSDLADARVRDFVPILAWRRARESARTAVLALG